ncbi:MAG: hypothetical protein KC425_10960 [Anaerolineales bacterium]|nr:hypothetical protein [Anaerolineales bacterium]
MYRKLHLLFLFALTFALAGAAAAQGTPAPEHSDPAWQASYWNNVTLSGSPRLQRTETAVNHDWGAGSPDPAVNADRFSARWTRILDLPAGRYRFSAVADDGIRVIVDDQPLISEWHDHPATHYAADVTLAAGHHQVVVEYYENGGQAVAQVSWEAIDGSTDGWRGEYFANQHLSGSPVMTRTDVMIQFDWGYGTPFTRDAGDNFSVRWTRTLDLAPAMYRFTTTTDDGVRLWVDGHLLIDDWTTHPAALRSNTIYASGPTTVVMEYFENWGLASAQLGWEIVTNAGSAVVVDDTDAGFVRGGSAGGWRTAPEGYSGRLIWTNNNETTQSNYNWARWYPTLAAGRYEVFVYVPDRFSTTTNARYWVAHRDGYTLRSVNQSTSGGQWVSLGTYWFQGSSADYVSLSDITFEPYLSRLIAFDAVKWEAWP